MNFVSELLTHVVNLDILLSMKKLVKTITKYLVAIIKGMLIGLAVLIPGVSGGSMIMSMGIYEQAVSITSKDKRVRNRAILFMIPYVIGIVLGVLLLAGVMQWCFAHYPLQTALAFIGMILGSLPMLYRKVKGKKFSLIGALLFVLMVAIMIALPHFTQGNASLPMSFVGAVTGVSLGFLAAGTMIVPGISGSMVMLVLGYYHSLLAHIDRIKEAVFAILGGNGFVDGLGEPLFVLGFFGIGVILGLLLVSRGIKYLLSHKPVPTYYAIMALMLTSPYPIILKGGFTLSMLTPLTVITGLVVFVLGFTLAMVLDKREG